MGTASAQAPRPARPDFPADIEVIYKTVDDPEFRKLVLHMYQPPDWLPTDRRPAIVFFHGGGYRGGTPQQLGAQCRHLAERGMVAFSAQYRLLKKGATTLLDPLTDGKAALRHVRQYASELGVDPDRIAAGGGSAGGHLAATIATTPDEPPFDTAKSREVSTMPNALVLFNPAVDLRFVKNRRAEVIGDLLEPLSPTANVSSTTPPTLIMHGDADTTVDVQRAKDFDAAMQKVGGSCELVIYPGAGHGFFNYGRNKNKDYESTLGDVDRFFDRLGWTNPESTDDAPSSQKASDEQ